MKKISACLGKGVLWAMFTLIFGLLQLWVVLANDYVLVKHGLDFNEILLSGTLLFFTSAVVSTICTDYYLGVTGDVNKLVGGIIYFIYPVVVLMLCIWLFSLNFSTQKGDVDIEVIKNIQVCVIVMTAVYAIATKTMMFFQED